MDSGTQRLESGTKLLAFAVRVGLRSARVRPEQIGGAFRALFLDCGEHLRVGSVTHVDFNAGFGLESLHERVNKSLAASGVHGQFVVLCADAEQGEARGDDGEGGDGESFFHIDSWTGWIGLQIQSV
jgi:hypothetical protein